MHYAILITIISGKKMINIDRRLKFSSKVPFKFDLFPEISDPCFLDILLAQIFQNPFSAKI